jgi:HPt (histidine-containing phosphotransfer) domain-containing protein
MKRLWMTHLPELEARVSVLESGAHSLACGDDEFAELAQSAVAAHKLAGVLGTFGLHEGTELAREAEELCTSATANATEISNRLLEIAKMLRTLIQDKH